MHSPVEMVNIKDLDQVADILAAFALDLKSGEEFKVQV
jgi:putative aminopeptidase FrvX